VQKNEGMCESIKKCAKESRNFQKYEGIFKSMKKCAKE